MNGIKIGTNDFISYLVNGLCIDKAKIYLADDGYKNLKRQRALFNYLNRRGDECFILIEQRRKSPTINIKPNYRESINIFYNYLII